jgi:hypothetical protein
VKPTRVLQKRKPATTTNAKRPRVEAAQRTPCFVCGKAKATDVLVHCTGSSCSKVYHLYCLWPPLFKVPKDESSFLGPCCTIVLSPYSP